MTVTIYTHPACLAHNMGPQHPERPDRLKAVQAALEREAFSSFEHLRAPQATREQICRVHPEAYYDAIEKAAPAEGLIQLDGDTAMCPDSFEAALRAAGAVCAAVDTVMSGAAKRSFCAVRPPGHHAEPNRPMGFCIFSNVAIGAQHARAVHGIRRIAVIDFDVHHGNGTQAAFWDEPDLLYVSTHQSPLYPGTGAAEERGKSDNIVNVPLPPTAGSQAFRQAFEGVALPALDAFKPELVMISAGFDAHARDPLAQLEFQTEDYHWVTAMLVEVANRHAGGRIVSALEGGYDLTALRDGTAAHLEALAG